MVFLTERLYWKESLSLVVSQFLNVFLCRWKSDWEFESMRL